MAIENIEAVFEKFNDEFLAFERVEHKLSKRPDLHAFLLLDSLLPGNTDIVSAAEHDEIFLDVEPDKLAETAVTEEHIRDLVRCGVRIGDYDGLCMFV